MKTIDETTLTKLLIEGRFIESDAKPSETAQLVRPWFIALLVGASGWLAGIFLIAFVGVLFMPTSALGWAIASAIGFAAAFALYAIDKESAFFDQLALALWIAGQCAFVALMWEVTRDKTAIAGTVAAMQCVLAVVTPNRFARLIASFFACIAWGLMLRFALWNEKGFFSKVESADLLPALLASLVTWLPVIALIVVLILKERRWMASGRQYVFRPVLTGLLLGASFGPLATQPEAAFPGWQESLDFDNWLALLPLLATVYAGFALCGAFMLRHAGLMGAAIVGMLIHLFQFYYVLGISLLMKSAIMLIVGALLLIATSAIAKRETV